MKFTIALRYILAMIFIMGYSGTASARRPSKKKIPYKEASPQSPPNKARPYHASYPGPMPTPMPSTSSSIPKKEVATLLPPPIKKIAHRNQRTIVIDPGHGGEDFGTHSLTKPKYHEKYLNLITSEMLVKCLEQYGYHVIMTRTEDIFISLENRAQFANDRNALLFVSIHYNSAPSTDAEGVEVFYYRTDQNPARVTESKVLAQCVLDRILKNTKANSRGVKHGNFSVIRHTKMPAILIEGGFLTNTGEMNKIKTLTYQKKIAQGIAQGIKDFLAKENVLAGT